MVDVVDCNVAELAPKTDNWPLVCNIVVQSKRRYSSFARELDSERETFHHGDLDTGLLNLIDQDLIINEGQGDTSLIAIR